MSEKRQKKLPRREAPAGSTGPMDVGLLEQIIQLMAANDLSAVDLRDGGRRIILKRGQVVPTQMMMASAPPAPVAAPMPAAPRAAAAAPAADDDASFQKILSPMVGTFYSAPKPGEKPYVTVGSVVNDETDVCIIEAMKTFNVHKAGVRGSIAKMLVQDGQTVQFDQPLFLVKP